VLNAQSYPPPSNLITLPTAGTLQRGSFALEMRIQKFGGLTSSISVGLTDRFQLGISYGSANLIGDDSLIWYPKPETNLKYLLIDESESTPGISLGIDTQGLGKFNSGDSLMRYDTKALGLFAVASKNWVTPLGNLGWHFGSNYNFVETNDNDKDVNFFMGFDIEFNPELSIMLEYNAALNENNMTSKNIAISRGGYLNAGIRWTFVERLHIEMDFNNLMFDKKKVDYFNREIKITYIEYF
tara:strand:- start:1955 stop:2677 length:723 start_codon:yes stop_codon:yes gene_type:complete